MKTKRANVLQWAIPGIVLYHLSVACAEGNSNIGTQINIAFYFNLFIDQLTLNIQQSEWLSAGEIVGFLLGIVGSVGNILGLCITSCKKAPKVITIRVLMLLLVICLAFSVYCVIGDTAVHSIITTDRATLRTGDAVDTGYQYMYFGRFDQDAPQQPVLWRVLSVQNEKAILLSEAILEVMPFDDDSSDLRQSNLYRWLNHDFYNYTFSKKEKELILADSYGDTVKLPTVADLTRGEYLFSNLIQNDNPQRRAMLTQHSYSKDISADVDNYNGAYYTATPTQYNDVNFVRTDGSIGVARVKRDDIGVRPMICVDCSQLYFSKGTGTKKDPYIWMAE